MSGLVGSSWAVSGECMSPAMCVCLRVCVHARAHARECACVFVGNTVSQVTSCFRSGCGMHRGADAVAGRVGAVGWATLVPDTPCLTLGNVFWEVELER